MAYVEGISLVLRFTQACDVALSADDQLLNEDIINTAYTRQHGIPLSPLGVGLDYYVFEPNDARLVGELSFYLRDGINDAVDGVQASGEVYAVQEDNNLLLRVSYINTKIGQSAVAMVPVKKQKVE